MLLKNAQNVLLLLVPLQLLLLTAEALAVSNWSFFSLLFVVVGRARRFCVACDGGGGSFFFTFALDRALLFLLSLRI